MEITILRHPRCRRPRLTVTGPGEARLTLPRNFPKDAAARFLEESREWLQHAAGRMENRDEGIRTLHRENPGKIRLLGEWRPYRLEEGSRRLHRFDGEVLVLRDGRGLERFYRDRAEAFFAAAAGEVASALGKEIGTIRIKEMKSRWGSCSARNNLNFNYHLVKAPEPVCRYVAVHEACHLEELNHSPRFWGLVGEFFPGWRETVRWLKAHGRELAYDPF